MVRRCPDREPAGRQVTLAGVLSDDGLPNPPGVTTAVWSEDTATGNVTFADPTDPTTTATFTAVGTYVLRLTEDDTALTGSDTVTITVTADGPVTPVNTSNYTFAGAMVAVRDGGDAYWVVSDHLSSTSVTVNAATGVVATSRYYPFGTVRTAPGVQPTDRTYTGQINDGDTGLAFYNARYYDPALGRFTQPDTIIPDIRGSQDLNLFTYVRNNPIRYTDPTGFCAEAVSDAGGCTAWVQAELGVWTAYGDPFSHTNPGWSHAPAAGGCRPKWYCDFSDGVADLYSGLVQLAIAPSMWDDAVSQGAGCFLDPVNCARAAVSECTGAVAYCLGGVVGGLPLGGAGGQVARRSIPDGIIERFDGPSPSGGQRIALGLGDGLGDFADAQAALTYRDFPGGTGRFADDFYEYAGNPKNDVLFNLDGVRNPWSSVQRAGDLTLDDAMRAGASITDWELAQIYRNDWTHVQFFENGMSVPSPFGG